MTTPHAMPPTSLLSAWSGPIVLAWSALTLAAIAHELFHAWVFSSTSLLFGNNEDASEQPSWSIVVGSQTLAKRSFHQTLGQLASIPFGILFNLPSAQLHVRIDLGGSKNVTALTVSRHGGWIFSVLLALAWEAWSAMHAWTGNPAWLAVSGALWLVAFCAVASDLPSRPTLGRAGGVVLLGCGNIGVLVAGLEGRAVDYEQVLKTQIAISMQRGAQSGGLVTLTGKGQKGAAKMPRKDASAAAAVPPIPPPEPARMPNQPRAVRNAVGLCLRSAPRKRQNLSSVLSGQFRRSLGWKATTQGLKPGQPSGHGIFAGHTRFATSSLPSVQESHPHQWTPQAPARVWRASIAHKALTVAEENCGLWITHNGDFDFGKILGKGAWRTHHEMSLFLHAVLGTTPPAHCDSIAVAGMMEFLRCQGRWDAAVRLAFFDTATTVSFESVVALVQPDAPVASQAKQGAATPGGAPSTPKAIRSAGDPPTGEDTPEGGSLAASSMRIDLETGPEHTKVVAPTHLQLKEFAAATESALEEFIRRGGALPRAEYLGDNDSWDIQQDEEEDVARDGWAALVAPGAEALRMRTLLGGEAGRLRLLSHLTTSAQQYIDKQRATPGGQWVNEIPSAYQLVAAALDAFIFADLYAALVRFLKNAKGSFGLAVVSSLDTDRIALAAWGQPMTVGFSPDEGAIVYASESQNVMIPLLPDDPQPNNSTNGWRKGMPTHRCDIDEGNGEVMLFVLHHAHAYTPATPEQLLMAGVSMEDIQALYHGHSVRAGLPAAIRSALAPTLNDPSRHGAPEPAKGAARVTVSNYELCGLATRQELSTQPITVLRYHQRSIRSHIFDGWAPFVDGVSEAATLGPFSMRLYQIKKGHEVTSLADFKQQGRLVHLRDHPHIRFLPPPQLAALRNPGSTDLVNADIMDIPRVLSSIRDDWNNPDSGNRATAEALFDHLYAIHEAHSTLGCHPDPIAVDVLLVGAEVSLWTCEQLANDLRLVWPALRVTALSANKVISVLGNARGSMPQSGSAFCLGTAHLGSNTVALCVSQSGQTFPTIHATRILSLLLPGRVYVMTGQADSKMALAMGQQFSAAAEWSGRIFTSMSGWRSAEPASLVCVAMHHTMTELLFFLSTRFADNCFGIVEQVARPGRMLEAGPLGMAINPDQLLDLRVMRDSFISVTVPQLVGYDVSGASIVSKVHDTLVARGRKWAQHVTETPMAWVLSLIHIMATVISGWPVLYAIVHGGFVLDGQAGSKADQGLSKVALFFDSIIYMCLPWIYAGILRLMQQRPLLHRFGKRTLVICDVPMVHQIVESYVSKLWALSWGMAGLDVHGAAPQDHFVHRFTHRVVRGLLLAVGRPDGRLFSQTKAEAATLLAMLQAKVIQHLGGQPEVLAVGHNGYHPKIVVDHQITLPSCRPQLLVEALESAGSAEGADPNQMWAARRAMTASSQQSCMQRAQHLHQLARSLPRYFRLTRTEAAAALPSDLPAHSVAVSVVPSEPSSATAQQAQQASALMPFETGLRIRTGAKSGSRTPGLPSGAATPSEHGSEGTLKGGRPLGEGIEADSSSYVPPGLPLLSRGSIGVADTPMLVNLMANTSGSVSSSVVVPVGHTGRRSGTQITKSASSDHLDSAVTSIELSRSSQAAPGHVRRKSAGPRTSAPLVGAGQVSGATKPIIDLLLQDLLDLSAQDLAHLLSSGTEAQAIATPGGLSYGSYVIGQHLVLNEVASKNQKKRAVQRSASLLRVAAQLQSTSVSNAAALEALAGLKSQFEAMLGSQGIVETLLENRYLALERMIAFFVVFHAMARRTADWWPLTFDISRSQSGLRIATTAAPATASDLERSLAEIYGAELLERERQAEEEMRRVKAIAAITLRVRNFKRTSSSGALNNNPGDA